MKQEIATYLYIDDLREPNFSRLGHYSYPSKMDLPLHELTSVIHVHLCQLNS